MSQSQSFQLALTGDSIITRKITTYQDEPTRALFEKIRDADVAFTNLEVLPNDFQGYPAVESGGSHLAASSWVMDDLVEAGFDVFACANNHSMDYSIAGLLSTMKVLEDRGIAYAGVGRNLADARMPVYVDTKNGSVAMLSAASSFAKGQHAGEQRPDMQGRPGLNPLRIETTYEVSQEQLAALRSIADELGIEQQRLDKVQLGFAFPPDSPDIFPFLESNFRKGSSTSIRTEPKAKDLEEIGKWTREAKRRADIAIVSIHAHEQGRDKEEPAEFIRAFAHYVIDQGADVVVGHGPHLLRGMEMYQGSPIFYSLGNFVGQNELVYKVPADSYERFRADPQQTPGELYQSRTQNDTKSFPADKRYWQSLMPVCEFEDGRLVRIELFPVALGHGEAAYRRGRPRLAVGTEADEILDRFAELSRPFGTTIKDRSSVQLQELERSRGT